MDSSQIGEGGDGFANLGLRDELLDALTDLGYEEPTPVQRETIPHLIEGRDLVGQAATGTGKTAAFALPLLHSLDIGKGRPAASALVLVPTRELAMQVSEAIFKYGRQLGVKYYVTGKAQSAEERTEDERRVQYWLFMQVIDVETSAIKWQHKAYVTKAVR